MHLLRWQALAIISIAVSAGSARTSRRTSPPSPTYTIQLANHIPITILKNENNLPHCPYNADPPVLVDFTEVVVDVALVVVVVVLAVVVAVVPPKLKTQL